MKPPYLIGISECLTGAKVRYDGKGKQEAYPAEVLKDVFTLQPVCPEVGIGMSVPRAPIQLVRTPKGTRAMGVADKNVDVTQSLEAYAEQKWSGLCGFVFMERSPSCGLNSTKVHLADGEVAMGLARGIFARAFVASHPYLPCVEAQDLWDKGKRDGFVQRVEIFSQWQEITDNGSDEADKLAFCATYQPLIKETLSPENPLRQLMLTLSQEAVSQRGDATD